MPSTSAKQHRFMQAVAHSPSFAKKAGVSQSVGKDFSSADKGSDMKKGKRFSGEDGKSEVTYSSSGKGEAYSNPEKEDDLYTVVPDTSRPPSEAKPKPKLESKPSDDESFDRSASTVKSTPTREPDTRAVTGMASRKYKNMPSDEKKAESAERIKDMTMAAASLTPIGKLGRVGPPSIPLGPTYRERQNFLRESEKAYIKQRGELSRGESLTPGPNLYGRRGFTSKAAADAVAKKYGKTGMKQGGSIMESKSIKFAMGGMMKKGKRFNGEDGESEVEYHEYDPDKTYSGRFTDDETGGLAENTPTRSTAKAAPAAPARAAPASRTTAADTYAAAARNRYVEALGYKKASENKNTSPAAQSVAKTQYDRALRDYSVLSGGYEHARAKNLKQGGTIMGMKKGGMPPEVMAAMMAKRAAGPQPMRRPPPGGMPPPAQPPMGMNKGGMPMKDGKPAFMQKKMMGGGMAYAKGGGIESRGKTKGTVIRMAAGGSVSSRADGIAQRGKTKFTNY